LANSVVYSLVFAVPNLAFERDAAKARRPSTLRYASWRP
jgi:hypothetical protein